MINMLQLWDARVVKEKLYGGKGVKYRESYKTLTLL